MGGGNGEKKEDRLNTLEDKQAEIAAKQDVLLGHLQQLGKKLDGTTSEMRSNYVASVERCFKGS